MTQEEAATAGTKRPKAVVTIVVRSSALPCSFALIAVMLSPVTLLAQQGGGQHGESSRSGPRMQGSMPYRGALSAPRPNSLHANQGQHLPEWFAHHEALPPAQQEDALRREPGFARLPPAQQQQLINRLHRLDMEPPAQRQRMMERNERFEALSPERQQEIRGASQALSQMPPERRQALRQAFRELRQLPPEARVSSLNSARSQAEYSPQERTVLGNLLSIEPYQPEEQPADSGSPRF